MKTRNHQIPMWKAVWYCIIKNSGIVGQMGNWIIITRNYPLQYVIWYDTEQGENYTQLTLKKWESQRIDKP